MQKPLVVVHKKRFLKDRTCLQKHQPLLVCSCMEAEADATGSACFGDVCLPEPYASWRRCPSAWRDGLPSLKPCCWPGWGGAGQPCAPCCVQCALHAPARMLTSLPLSASFNNHHLAYNKSHHRKCSLQIWVCHHAGWLLVPFF